jgi:hypothetical protein
MNINVGCLPICSLKMCINIFVLSDIFFNGENIAREGLSEDFDRETIFDIIFKNIFPFLFDLKASFSVRLILFHRFSFSSDDKSLSPHSLTHVMLNYNEAMINLKNE